MPVSCIYSPVSNKKKRFYVQGIVRPPILEMKIGSSRTRESQTASFPLDVRHKIDRWHIHDFQ